MLSAIVVSPPARADRSRAAGAWLGTLAALVPAAIEGVVRDVTLLHVGADSGLAAIADEAGCRLVEDADFPRALARSVSGARSAWIFAVTAGTLPSRAFGEEVARGLSEAPAHGTFMLREIPRGGLAYWIPSLATVAGVVLPRARLVQVPCRSFADVVRLSRKGRPLPSGASRA